MQSIEEIVREIKVKTGENHSFKDYEAFSNYCKAMKRINQLPLQKEPHFPHCHSQH